MQTQINESIVSEIRAILKEKILFHSDQMTYPYANNSFGGARKMAIAGGLAIWEIIRNIRKEKKLDDASMRSFLRHLLRNLPAEIQNNYLAKVVVWIEYLPTAVWRRLLWRNNIDFMSFESCLRRLDTEQMKALEDNFKDFCAGRLPRVMKKGWRNRLKAALGINSYQKLLKSSHDPKHYESRGAWAFNLLGLDFGFSLYPQGEANDTQITNQKFTRFLSVKEHINDFIVNQENGKYWWLYRTARSNFAFWPNKKVDLKNHICPGFWATFVIQALFWIVAPIATVTAASIIATQGLVLTALLPIICSLPLTLWLLVATLRIFFAVLANFNWIGKVLKFTILYPIIAAIIAIVVGVILYGSFLSIVWLMTFLGPLLGPLLFLTAAFYLFFLIFCVLIDNHLFEYRDIPKFIQGILHGVLIASFLFLFERYLLTPLISGIVYLAQSFWSWYTADLLLSNWLLLSLLFISVFVYFSQIFLEDEKKFIRMERIFRWLVNGFMILTLVLFIYLGYLYGGDLLSAIGWVSGLAFAIVLSSLGAAMMMNQQVNSGNIEQRSLFWDSLDKLLVQTGITARIDRQDVNRIMKNPWLSGLKAAEINHTLLAIYNLGDLIFGKDSRGSFTFFNLMIKSGNQAILTKLQEADSKLFWAQETDTCMQIVRQVVYNGLTVEAAAEKTAQANAKHYAATARVRRLKRSLARPFVIIYAGIDFLFEKISQFCLTLKDIWALFNERCPFVSRPKQLN